MSWFLILFIESQRKLDEDLDVFGVQKNDLYFLSQKFTGS